MLSFIALQWSVLQCTLLHFSVMQYSGVYCIAMLCNQVPLHLSFLCRYLWTSVFSTILVYGAHFPCAQHIWSYVFSTYMYSAQHTIAWREAHPCKFWSTALYISVKHINVLMCTANLSTSVFSKSVYICVHQILVHVRSTTLYVQHISGEIVELCEVIRAHGRMTGGSMD